jgi:hypothetical protein
MEYELSPARRFAVVIGRVRYSIARQDGGIYSGPCCDECTGTFFDIEHWSSRWCAICQDCGRRYIACAARRA